MTLLSTRGLRRAGDKPPKQQSSPLQDLFTPLLPQDSFLSFTYSRKDTSIIIIILLSCQPLQNTTTKALGAHVCLLPLTAGNAPAALCQLLLLPPRFEPAASIFSAHSRALLNTSACIMQLLHKPFSIKLVHRVET